MSNQSPILHQFTRFHQINEPELTQLKSCLAAVIDWYTLLKQIELYGLSGFVLKHVQQHNLPIDKTALVSLKALSLRHKSMADARYQTLLEISQVFSQANVPMLLLKGAALAPMLYPNESLRPMRDMDILIPKQQVQHAAQLLRDMGFTLPEQQPSKYMRDAHQLPNATKKVAGFTISVELHHDALASDVRDHLTFAQAQTSVQTIQWRDLTLQTLNHELMLHQLCRHLEGLHSGAVLKLINVMDVVAYAEKYLDQIDWQSVAQRYPHSLNTLKCLHLIMPLSAELQTRVGGVNNASMNDIGVIMSPLSTIFSNQRTIKQTSKMLFSPSDWWLHLYYNVDPAQSLYVVKLIRHPLTIAAWLLKRFYSRLLGG